MDFNFLGKGNKNLTDLVGFRLSTNPFRGLGGFANPPFSVKFGDSFAEFAENTAIAVFFHTVKNPSAKYEGLCRWIENPAFRWGSACFFRLLQLEGARVELVVFAALGDEVRVAAALNDAPVFQHHDHVRILHG